MGMNLETKKKYNLEIAGIQLSILSDESEEFVNDLVSKLDKEITDLTVHNKRCAKIDAAILIALDALGEKTKLEKKLKNLEAQIALYEANLRRHREEAPEEKPKETAEEKKAEPAAEAEKAEEKPAAEKPKKTSARKKPLQQLAIDEGIPAEKASADKQPAETAPVRKDKIRQIESLLRDGSATGAQGGKLAEIEQLLREGGKSSLSEALTDAAND